MGKSEPPKQGCAVSLLSHLLVAGSSFASGNVLGEACVKFQQIEYVSQNEGHCLCLQNAGLTIKILHTTLYTNPTATVIKLLRWSSVSNILDKKLILEQHTTDICKYCGQ